MSDNSNDNENIKTKHKHPTIDFLLASAKYTSLFLALIFSLLLFLLMFFPVNFAKSLAFQNIEILTDSGLEIGQIDYSLFTGITIHNISINAPAGYTKDILTINKIELDYNLFSLLSNKMIVDQLLIDSPHINIESINKQTNIEALLQKFEGEKTEEVLQPEEPSDSESASDFEIVLSSLSLKNLSANFDDTNHLVKFAYLSITANGFYSSKDSYLKANVSIKPKQENEASISISQNSPTKVAADILCNLVTQIEINNLPKPVANIDLDLQLESKKIESSYKIEPLKLSINLQADADLSEEKANVQKLLISFNEANILELTASASDLLERRKFSLLINKLILPFAKFAPYTKAFMPEIDFGGSISIANLKSSGSVEDILEQILPVTNATITAKDIWVKYKPTNLAVDTLDATIDIATNKSDDKHTPRIYASGKVSLKSAKADIATLKNLVLDLDLQADSTELTDVLASIGLAVQSIEYNDPNYSTLAISLLIDSKVKANIKDGKFFLQNLDLNISDTIKLQASAKADIDLQTRKINSHNLKLKLLPLNLKELFKLLSPVIKKVYPGLSATGNFSILFESSGSMQAKFTDIFALPVEFSNTIKLSKISVTLPKDQLEIKNLSGTITQSGKPKDMLLLGELKLEQIKKLDQQLTISKLVLPINAKIKAKSKTMLELELLVNNIDAKLQAVKIDNIRLKLVSKIEGNILKQKYKHLTGKLSLELESLIYAKDTVIKLFDKSLSLEFNYNQKKRQAKVSSNLNLGEISLPEKNFLINNFDIQFNALVKGVDMPILPNADQHAEHSAVEIKLGISKINLPDMLPLNDTNLKLSAVLYDMKDVELSKLEILVPSLAAEFNMTGEVKNLFDKNMKPPNFKTVFPDFDVEVFAGVNSKNKTEIADGLHLQGLAGIKTRVRSLPNNKMKMEGVISAEHFYLWNKILIQKVQENGLTKEVLTEISISDFNTDVPLSQFIDMQKRNLIYTDYNIYNETTRGVLYETLRRYTKQQANFHIKNITWKQTEGSSEKHLEINELSLDMLYANNTFAINRLYIDLLGGGITGAFQLQLLTLPPDQLDFRIHFENQITGVNLAYLTANKNDKVSKETEVSSLINLNFSLLDKHLDGRIDFTRLSLKQLDALLVFLDPDGKDPKVQQNRAMINAWYIEMIKPKVKLVSMWVEYGNLNLDIEMEAWFFVGTILQSTLNKSRIRRLNLIPILDAFLPSNNKEVSE